MNTQKQIFLMVVLFFVLVGGCAAYTVIDLPIRSERQTGYFNAESVRRGALLYANNCRTCHGIKGEGGVGLPVNKADFQDPDPLKLKANRELLKRTLYCGRAGTLMPAWLNTNGGALTDRQVEHIIDLITSPVDEQYLDDEGNPTSKGWLEAVDYAENLNHETSAIVGGDTLDTIAKAHQVGYQELADANGLSIDATIAKGTKLKLPDGRTFKVLKEGQTVARVADDQHVGVLILADLNGLNYKFDTKKNRFTLLDQSGTPLPGLFPGDKLALPDGAGYVVKAGDSLESVATQHSLATSSLVSANNKLLGAITDQKAPLDYERKLKLASNAVYIVSAGQTVGVIATRHGVKAEDLLKANPGLTAEAPPAEGQALTLPSGALYVVQSGDTLASIAAAHRMDVGELASLNGLQPNEPIGPEVVLQLPKVGSYVVDGQNLEDLAKAYSNVTAAGLAQANGIGEKNIIAIGSSLKLPADAWGPAPPDTKNPGTACVQHTVPASVFQTLPGVGTPVAEPTAPATVSKDVKIDAHTETTGNDWVVTADGVAQPKNEGAVLVAKGTAVLFDGVSGLHTITLAGKKDNGDLKQGDKRTITFNDTGKFKITCDYHPDMIAYVFVQ